MWAGLMTAPIAGAKQVSVHAGRFTDPRLHTVSATRTVSVTHLLLSTRHMHTLLRLGHRSV